MAKTLTRSMTYSELIAEITASTLNKNEKITITDFATTHYMMNGAADVILDAELNPVINTGATEPLTVTALNSNTLDKVATSELYPQDIIHYDWNGENWKYDLAFGAWDEEVLSGWKGVIYFRHDTLNDVSMGHDFRKVLNRRWVRNDPYYDSETTYAKGDKVQVADDGVYVSLVADNTGNAVSSSAHWVKIIDYAITKYWCVEISKAEDETDFIDVPCFYSQEADPEGQYNREVKTVHFKPMKDDGSTFYWIATILQNNVYALEPNFGWHQVMGISAEMFCLNNTFSGYQEGNVLGANFQYNSIGANFIYNSIGAYFIRNSIGADFQYNSIGAYFRNNSIGANFSSNSIGANFRYNSIGANFISNSIGAYFSSNSIGANFNNNDVKDGFNKTGVVSDFLAATHVYAEYNCELFLRADGTRKLKYVNNSDETVIVDATA